MLFWFNIDFLECAKLICYMCINYCAVTKSNAFWMLYWFPIAFYCFSRMCEVEVAYLQQVLPGYRKPCISKFMLTSYWFTIDFLECAKLTLACLYEILRGYEKPCIRNWLCKFAWSIAWLQKSNAFKVFYRVPIDLGLNA